MSEGSKIRESWSTSLVDAQTRFRSLLASSSSSQWKRIPTGPPQLPKTEGVPAYHNKGKARSLPTSLDAVVHRRVGKDGEVYRAMLDVHTEEPVLLDLDNWKAVLQTPEVRKSWDPMVQGSHLVELLDPDTRIAKTEFSLGWPANPRDAITISRTFSDPNTLIDISTSLPRSPDDPAYLRPSPPYVRSQVHLSSWCIQFQSSLSAPLESSLKSGLSRVRITCFWQHDLTAVWGMTGGGIGQHLPTLLVGLVETVRHKGNRIPRFVGYGFGISVFSVVFGESGREALVLEYAIIMSEDDDVEIGGPKVKSLEEVRVQKEKRRLERTIEIGLPSMHGWDVQVTVKAPSEETAAAPWMVRAGRSVGSEREGIESSRVIFRLTHPRPPTDHIVSVKVVAELAGGIPGLRINSVPYEIETFEPRDPTSFTIDKGMLGDVSSVQGISINTANTNASTDSTVSVQANQRPMVQTGTERKPGAEKSILTLVRRNYIYFTSLLQEPEAKWKPITEARGVTVTQLDSIDPTLVVYRAEAVFVGLGLWDLFGTIDTPGIRASWDRSFEDASLLEDVNELTQLWHFKTRGAWPVNARDSVLLKTSYKSSSSVHLFAFSTDDSQLFPTIPAPELAVIRSQVDLQGWAIEALSPTTTQVTLLDQSDPKGWSNKSYIPQQMIATIAGIGEFAIKSGTPPIVSRLGGAKVNWAKYEHDKGVFRLEYEGSERRRTKASPLNGDHFTHSAKPSDASTKDAPSLESSDAPLVVGSLPSGSLFNIECELRLDPDSWASNVEIIVDPPPQAVTCLRRHRLSGDGGGLWVTIEHDAAFTGEDRLLVQVRKVPGGIKEKAVVMVNGARVKVDVVELPESEVKLRSRKKRVKPSRMPLDQPPVLGFTRRRPVEDDDSDGGVDAGVSKGPISRMSMQPFTTPLARFFNMAVEQAATTTTAAAAAMGPTPASLSNGGDPSATTGSPMQAALKALSTLRRLYAVPASDWTPVSDKGGFAVVRKLDDDISSSIPVHRAVKVIEGVSAGDAANIVTDLSCRKLWDERFDAAIDLEEYGFGCSTAFVTLRTAFPFQNRGFYVASITSQAAARHANPSGDQASVPGVSTPTHSPATIYHATASFLPSSSSSGFSSSKVNPLNVSVGQILLQGWVLEMLDPYTTENYAIPSTRVSHFAAIDFAGTIPVAMNSMINGTLSRAIFGLQAALKTQSPVPSLRWPAKRLVISEDNDEQNSKATWEIRVEDKHRTVLSQSFTSSLKTFRSSLLIKPSPPSLPTRPPSPTEKPSAMTGAKTPEPASLSKASKLPGSAQSTTAPVPFPSAPSTPAPANRAESAVTPASLPSTPSRYPLSHARTLSRPSPFRSTRAMSNAIPWLGSVIGKVVRGGDFVVAEIVLTPELFSGEYEVAISCKIVQGDGKDKPLDLGSQSSAGVSTALASSQVPEAAGVTKVTATLGAGGSASGAQVASASSSEGPLPIQSTIYTLPPSPLHSHSLDPSASSNPPAKHLLRLTLPTSAYYEPIRDPLTEDQPVPAPNVVRPPWLTEVEEKGAVVWITVQPLSGERSEGKGKGKVYVDRKAVEVLSERRSVEALGTEELEDERVGKMALLKRGTGKDEQALPHELRVPLAIAKHLCETPPPPPAVSITEPEEAKAESPTEPVKAIDFAATESPPVKPPATQNTLLGFFNTNPFARLAPAMPHFGSGRTLAVASSDGGPRPGLRSRSRSARRAGASEVPLLQRTYSLKVLLVVALISFLVGSLIRSLLSPADFMYLPPLAGDGDVEEEGGWREVKRLVEIKWIVWGWDAVIFAVVRRQ